MAKISVRCPNCQTRYRFDETFEGRKGRCRKCGGVFVATRRTGDASTVSPKPSPSGPALKAPEREWGEDGVPKVWQPGDVILDLYEITSVLGEGGMGTVFKARHTGWNIDLAVKSPKAEIFTKKGGIEDFVREAETWIDLGLHPHTVSCFYVRTLGGIPRVFAEYVEGGSLKEWIDDRRLYEGGPDKALERILDIAIQFAWGLHHAHEKGLIHQDVKPANVMMTPDGTAKVTDFGLAKAKATAGEVSNQDRQQSILVSAGGMTPAYCSPEQANKQPLSRKTDIWSWAVSALEVLCGEVTWPSGSVAAEALRAYLEMDNASDARLPTLPPTVAELLLGCLQHEPNDRPQDMAAVADVLRTVYPEVVGTEYPRELPSATEALATSLNNRAVSLLDLGKTVEAERAWEQALAADVHHPESTYNLGLVHWRTGRIGDQELIQRLSEVRASHPDQWIDEYLLARVHLERGDSESALALLQSIEDPGPRQAELSAALDLASRHSETGARWRRKLKGHSAEVSSIHLSGDSRHLLSGSLDTTLKVWGLSSGRCLRTFEEERSIYVLSVSLSADGRYALSGGRNWTLTLWGVSSGRCQRTSERHGGEVYSVCLSADGRHALSGSKDTTLKLWELWDPFSGQFNGRCLRTLEGHGGEVRSVCLSGDDRYALSGSSDTTLKLWELWDPISDQCSGRCLHTFEGHRREVHSVCLSGDGCHALSGSCDKTLKLWELASGRCLRTFEGHRDEVHSVSLSADGRYALSGSRDETLKLWELGTGRCLRTFEGHSGSVHAVCLSGDSRYAFSGSADTTVKLWQTPVAARGLTAPLELSVVEGAAQMLTASRKYQQHLQGADQAIAGEDFGGCAEHLRRARAQSGCSRHPDAIARWGKLYRCLPRRDFAAAWEVATLKEHSAGVTAVCLSDDACYALSGSRDDTLRLWELAKDRCLRTFKAHERSSEGVTSVSLSSDACYALSASDDHTLRLWDVSSGRCLRSILALPDDLTGVSLSGDGRYSLSGNRDVFDQSGTLRLYEASTGRCLRTLKGHPGGVNSVCLSGDGRYALSGGEDQRLRLWELSSGRCLRTLQGHSHRVSSVCLSGDGRHALSGSGDGTLRLWELASGNCLKDSKGHSDWVTSVCLSADGRYALSGSEDNTLKLWELASGDCLRTFEGHSAPVTSVCLSRDGRYALSASEDRTLKLWFLDWELDERELADWDEGARPYLEVFLTQQTPYGTKLPQGRDPTEDELQSVLTRRGKPLFTGEDFQRLLDTLGCAGYGWLRPEGVRRKLEEMAAEWKGPPPLPGAE